MLRSFALPLVLSFALAPYQCAREADPAKRREETPGEALYGLAMQFREQGNDEAFRSTLEYLIERYPSSRFATTARAELEAEGEQEPIKTATP